MELQRKCTPLSPVVYGNGGAVNTASARSPFTRNLGGSQRGGILWCTRLTARCRSLTVGNDIFHFGRIFLTKLIIARSYSKVAILRRSDDPGSRTEPFAVIFLRTRMSEPKLHHAKKL